MTENDDTRGTKTVRLLLVTDTGEVLDSTDPLEVSEWNADRNGAGAWALLQELRAVK